MAKTTEGTVSIRTWWDIDHDYGLGIDLDPIEDFVHSNEPQSGPGDNEEEVFRSALQRMLDHVYELGIGDICAESTSEDT